MAGHGAGLYVHKGARGKCLVTSWSSAGGVGPTSKCPGCGRAGRHVTRGGKRKG